MTQIANPWIFEHAHTQRFRQVMTPKTTTNSCLASPRPRLFAGAAEKSQRTKHE
jgi:hypothetical protein